MLDPLSSDPHVRHRARRLSYASEYDPYPCLERDRERGLRPETLEFAAYHERPATSPREDRAAGSAARARARRVVTSSRSSSRKRQY